MISINQQLPEATCFQMSDKGPVSVATNALFSNKKVVLFAVPGCFTPTCTNTHLPGYVVHYDQFVEKGVDQIICVAVNDPFVMTAWGKSNNADNIVMLSDANAAFVKALGLTIDLSHIGLGLRSQRFALVANNGVVSHLAVEPDLNLSVSSSESVLKVL